MIENGALENPKVDKVFAVHVWSELKTGTVRNKKRCSNGINRPI